MNKKLKLIYTVILCAAIVLTMGFVGCKTTTTTAAETTVASKDTATTAAAETTAASKDTLRTFVYSPPTLNNEFFIVISDAIKKEVESKGDKFVTLDPQFDQEKQISQIEDMITQGVSAILLTPVDSKGIKPALDSAAAKGIPVIDLDTDVFDKELVATSIITDNVGAGRLCGEDMAQRFPDGAKIAILDFPTNQACIDRVTGFFEGLGDKKDLFKVVAQQDGKAALEKSMPIAENIIQANPDVQAFFCINDPEALGVIAALKAANKLSSVLVYGIDGSPDAKKVIKSGELVMTSAQSPATIGKTGAESAYKVLAGETVEKDIRVPTSKIDASNVDKYGVDGWQ